MKPLSPLVLKILRLDHDGEASVDIANEVKLSEPEVNKILGSYRRRFFFSMLESHNKKDAFMLDVYKGMNAKDLANKYKKYGREALIISIVGTDKERSNVVKIRYRCDDCTNIMIFERDMLPPICPRCGTSTKKKHDTTAG